MAQAILGRTHETSFRLTRILDENCSRAPRVFKPALALMTLFAGLSFVIVPNMPRLIGFKTVGFETAAPKVEAASQQTAPQLSQAAVLATVAGMSNEGAHQNTGKFLTASAVTAEISRQHPATHV